MQITLSDEQLRAGLTDAGSKAAYARTLGVPITTLKDHLARHDILLERTPTPQPDVVDRLTAPDGMKMLCIDIETRPALAYVWDIWNVNISVDQLVATSEMLCWAAKWVGVPGVEYSSTFHDGKKAMIDRAWQLLDEADVVVHYNGKRFDIPHLNREFLSWGLTPPAPYHQIDLYSTVKARFRFQSNKLAHVSKLLGLGGKVETGGFGLWIKCLNDDPDAWAHMREYNIWDTVLLEDLYMKLRPWIASHPSFASFAAEDVCPKCSSKRLEWRGYFTTRTQQYHRFRCNDCGAWGRATKRAKGVTVTEAAL